MEARHITKYPVLRSFFTWVILSLFTLTTVTGCTLACVIDTEPPKKFSFKTANPIAPLVANLTWEKSDGAKTYRVMYGTTSGQYDTFAGETDTANFTVTGLSDGVTYYFMTTAVNMAGQQTALNEISLTVYSTISLASISPAQGFMAGEQVVTLTGTGFQPGTTVTIDGNPCTNVSIANSTTLTCLTPERLTTGSVNVAVTSPTALTATLTNAYTYDTFTFSKVESVSGTKFNGGYRNGIGTAAKFFRPSKPVVYGGYLYLTDSGNQMIRRMNMVTHEVEDVAGSPYKKGWVDGTGTSVRFYNPIGLVAVGSNIFIADQGNCLIRKLDTTTLAVTTVVGQGNPCTTSYNANGALAGLGSIGGALTTDGTYLYVADPGAGSNFVKISASPPYGTSAVSINASPGSIPDMVYLNNAIYFVECSIYCIVKKADLSVSPANITLVAGSTGSGSDVDGTGAGAAFGDCGGLTHDGTNLYISVTKSSKLKHITLPAGVVTTVAGSGIAGVVDGFGTATKLDRPTGLFYQSGDIYMLAWGGQTIRRYNTSTTEVTTLAGGGQ